MRGPGLIAWRIWSIESEARNVTGRDAKDGHAQDILPLGKIINIIVESGKPSTARRIEISSNCRFQAAVYCACLLVVIATSAINSDVMFTVLDFVSCLPSLSI